MADFPKGTDAELKLRLRLCEAGEVGELIAKIWSSHTLVPFAGENE